MKKIIVNDKSAGAVKVPVRIFKKINGKTVMDIIKELDMFNKLIDYHYNVCQEYKNTEDVGSDSMIEYISEVLYEEYNASDDDCEAMAKAIVNFLEEELIEEICDRDDNARDYYETREEARKGNY